MKKNANATKAFTSSLKSIGANIGIMLAITLAVQLLAKAYDELVVTMEEQQEIVDGLKTDIEGLSAEYDILNKKGNLTDQEKARLEMLERQLELKKELLAIEQKELADKELRQDNQGLLNHKGAEQYSLDVARQSKQLDQVRDRINNGGYGGWVLDDYIQQEQDLMQSLEDNRISMMQELQYYSDRYDKIQANLDAGIYDGNPEEKANWENQLQIAKNKMGELQTLIDNTEFVLGVSIDVNVAKEHIEESVKGVSDEWLDSLSDEELTYLFRLDNIGEYTPEELKEVIDNLHKEAKSPIEIKVTTADIITELDDMSEGFEKISEIYNDIKDMGDFDFSNLSKNSDFGAIFGETEGFEEFVDVVAKSPSDIKACQSAFDNLVSSWIDAQSPFENINEENKEAYINWLKSKGVVNAVEYANYALAKSTGNLNNYLVSETDATYKAFLAGRDLKDITYEEVTAFLNSAKASNLSTNALQMLQAQMVMVNNQKLNFSQQIGELMKIATAAGVATEMLSGRQLDRAARRNGVSSVQYLYDQLVGELNTLDVGVDFKPTDTGGGGSSSSKDPHIAEVDKYKTLTDAVDEYDRKLEKLERIYDHTDNIEERIALKNEEIKLYQQQKDAIEELNNVRDDEIFDKVNLLRDKGFKIDYDSATEQLIIHNREHINDLNQDIIEEYEDYIERIDDLNDANKESADQWDELTYAIMEAADEIAELRFEQYEKYIEDQEHLIDLMANRKDAEGKDLYLYDNQMNATLKTWKDLVEDGYEKNKEKIQELEKAWMDYYDARIEREKELLENQLDDNDDALDAIIKVIDDELKGLDDQIESLQKINEERKESLELQKAQAELDKARNQKTRMVLRKGVGWVYEADEDAIRKAEEALADKEYESKVDRLEDEKEALEDLKEKWEEIPDVYEKEQNKLLMIEKLGADAEADILNDRTDAYEKFKDDYVDIQEQIKDKTDELEEHTSEAYLKIVQGFEAIAKLAGLDDAFGNKPTATSKTVQSSWYVNKDSKAPSQAKVGDLVYTKGGTYKITAKDENGKFTSQKVDNVSTDIKDGMWGTKIKDDVVESIDDVSYVAKEIVAINEELAEQTKNNVLSGHNLARIIADNTNLTDDEIAAIFENVDVTNVLSDYTDDNTDATDDNTRAIQRFIQALSELKIEVPIEEEEEVLLENFDDSTMSDADQAYVDQLQAAWITAMEQGNTELANQLHALADQIRLGYITGIDTVTGSIYDPYARTDKDGYSVPFTAESKSNAYGSGAQVAGIIGTTKSIYGLDSTNKKQVQEFIDAGLLTEEEAKNLVQLTGGNYDSDGTKKSVDSKGRDLSSWDKEVVSDSYSKSGNTYWTTVKYTDPDTGETITKQEANAYTEEQIRELKSSSNATDKNTASLDNNTDASNYAGDASYNAAESIKETGDSVVSGVKDAVSDISVDVNVSGVGANVGSGGSGSSGGSKNSTSSLGKVLGGASNVGKEVAATSDLGGGYTSVRYKDGSSSIYKKAKGGRNLVDDIYNVDEKGRELLIQPTQGRYVHLSAGSDVIPADITDVLWKFGQNPSGYIQGLTADFTKSINPAVLSSDVHNHYHIGNVEMNGVDDWVGFMNEIQHLPSDANQYSYIR